MNDVFGAFSVGADNKEGSLPILETSPVNWEKEKKSRRLPKKSAGPLYKCAMLTEYISTPVQKKVSLGEESWKFFSQFVSRYQWAFDDPSYSPRAAEITHAILNRGKDGCCTFWREGKYKYVLPVLHTRHFENALANQRKIYYVS